MDLTKEIDRLIDVALDEDIKSGDITTELCVPEHAVISGSFVLKQAGVLAGLPFLETIFKKINPEINVNLLVSEGSYHKAGTILAKVSGPARGILTGERVALNFIQHASGVATVTSQFVRKIAGLRCEILDTRKTLPGLRALEKYAVKVGGGTNHRFSLDDRFIIKRNHLSFLTGITPHPIKEAVRRVRQRSPGHPVEIEIHNFNRLKEALATDAEAIMLCRMMPYQIIKCVTEIRKTNKKVYIESLGTITLDTVRAFAETGVDGISIGLVTHSVPSSEIVFRLQ